ncbi:hypothetical protein BH20CHL3_BH20CHL3_07830 [soil metagenome]
MGVASSKRADLESAAAGIDDAKDGYAVRFAPVLDDVISEVVLADVRWPTLSWVANVRKDSKELKRVIEDLLVDISLASSPSLQIVLKDAFSFTLRAWGYVEANT